MALMLTFHAYLIPDFLSLNKLCHQTDVRLAAQRNKRKSISKSQEALTDRTDRDTSRCISVPQSTT